MNKGNIKAAIGCMFIIIACIAIIVSVIWSLVFNFMNIDMTELRLLIENPYPSVIVIISGILFMIGKKLIEGDH